MAIPIMLLCQIVYSQNVYHFKKIHKFMKKKMEKNEKKKEISMTESKTEEGHLYALIVHSAEKVYMYIYSFLIKKVFIAVFI